MRKHRLKCFAPMLILLFLHTIGLAQTIHHPELLKVADKFSFVIFSDPQVGWRDTVGEVEVKARDTQIAAIKEINAMEPMPAFALWLGDKVNVFDEKSVANFEDCIKDAKMTRVIVHGNHDTQPPYIAFRTMQKRINGIEDKNNYVNLSK